MTTPAPSRQAIEVRAMLRDGEEIALLDVREEGVFNQGHPFFAVSAPLSHLETRIDALVPRRGTRIVLMDQNEEGLAALAAERLQIWGYQDVAVLAGGLDGWRAAGLEVFAGIYVPSKAFGEFVEHRYDTPWIDAVTLKAWQDNGKDMLILDSRPYEEFHKYSLPGGIDCPGAELVHRVFDLVKRDSTTVVVNCAGRTRGIIGAQSLINAGLRNPVVTVKNGTAGWHLSGESMARGSSSVAPPPTPEGLRQAIEASERVARLFNVKEIDASGFLALRKESEDRSLYLFDVRSPEEYEAGHIPGSRSAPGGQLIQSTDHYVGTRGARLVLCDDNGVRARMTASWLLQLGWQEVCVLAGGLSALGPAIEKGPEQVRLMRLPRAPEPRSITAAALDELLKAGETTVLDLASSLKYRAGHVPGAWFIVRSRAAHSLEQVPIRKHVVLTSEDGTFAALAAIDVAPFTRAEVLVLQGGTSAWSQAGLPLATGLEHMADQTDDVWYSPYDYDDLHKSMNAYLTWEVDLIRQIENEGDVGFRALASIPAPAR